MELDEFEAPELDRIDSKSALDFTYWVLTYVDFSYPRNAPLTPHSGEEDQSEAMMQAIHFASSQINLRLQTSDMGKFKKYCLRKQVSFEQCLRDRGGIMFKGNSVCVSLGDSKRIIEYLDDSFVIRYLSNSEMTSDAWECTRIPDMIYL